MYSIYSYNVNGIRAAMGKGLVEWVRAAAPDFIFLQETKAQPEQIDEKPFVEMGYQCHWFSAQKKGYSGVGLLSRHPLDRVELGMGLPDHDSEGRVIRADIGEVSLLGAYFPSGSSGDERQAVKMRFLDDFQAFIDRLKQERPLLLIGGDFNICHLDIDIHNPDKQHGTSGFLPEERAWVSQFLASGFVDSFRQFSPEPHQYSWWSYRAGSRQRNKGWRIDYWMASQALAGRLRGAGIHPEAQHSDHCPVSVLLQP